MVKTKIASEKETLRKKFVGRKGMIFKIMPKFASKNLEIE